MLGIFNDIKITKGPHVIKEFVNIHKVEVNRNYLISSSSHGTMVKKK